MFILETRFSNDGYAFWFKLLELLSVSAGHLYETRNPADWQFLLAKTHVTEEIATKILNLLAELDAIDPYLWKQKVIWVQHLVDNFTEIYRKRGTPLPQKPLIVAEKPSTPGVSGVDNPAVPPIPDPETPQSKVKYSKVKYSKGVPNEIGQRTPRLSNNPQIAQMQEHLGFPKNGSPDPIPNPAKEANFIKKMLGRGFAWENIFILWQSKVAARGEFISMQWVNEDIGKGLTKNGTDKRHSEPPGGRQRTVEELRKSVEGLLDE